MSRTDPTNAGHFGRTKSCHPMFRRVEHNAPMHTTRIWRAMCGSSMVTQLYSLCCWCSIQLDCIKKAWFVGTRYTPHVCLMVFWWLNRQFCWLKWLTTWPPFFGPPQKVERREIPRKCGGARALEDTTSLVVSCFTRKSYIGSIDSVEAARIRMWPRWSEYTSHKKVRTN